MSIITIEKSIVDSIIRNQINSCANRPGSNIDGLTNYKCPLLKPWLTYGYFDESGYVLDYINEHIQDNSINNLRALCKTCYEVKRTQALSIQDVRIYMLFFYMYGFLGVIHKPEKFESLYASIFVKLRNYDIFIPISFVIHYNSHFVSVYISDKFLYYYNSGGPRIDEKYYTLIEELSNYLEVKIKYINIIQQSNTTGHCGYFAVNFLFSQYRNDSYLDEYTKVVDDDDTIYTYNPIDNSINGEKMIVNFKKSYFIRFLYVFNYIIYTVIRLIFSPMKRKIIKMYKYIKYKLKLRRQ